jgi:hypothetical protein
MEQKSRTIGAKIETQLWVKYLKEAKRYGWDQSEFVRRSAEFFYDYLIGDNRFSNSEFLYRSDTTAKAESNNQSNNYRQPGIIYASDLFNPTRFSDMQKDAQLVGNLVGGMFVLTCLFFKN